MLRYFFGDAELESLKCTLVGFGDASKDAYAANVYLARQTEDGNETSLVAPKTRVTPIKKITIPLTRAFSISDIVQINFNCL